MKIGQKFKDGVVSLFNSIANRRSATANNTFHVSRVSEEELEQIYKTGIGNKIVRIKSGYALKDSLQFSSEEDEEFYKDRLAAKVKLAATWMLVFGRGIVVLHEKGGNLSQPLPKNINPSNILINVFDGKITNVTNIVRDLSDERYYKPLLYNVRGYAVHHSRVVDFTYVKTTELDSPQYRYGGISEYELIYDQLINDGIIQRAIPHITEKNSTFFYKIADFKSLLQSKQEKHLLDYISKVEDHRSIYGAGILDKDDDIETHNQTMTDLDNVDTIGLRRLAMVTEIPLSWLIGENVKGLNSSGRNEMDIFWNMIDALQENYLDDPINQLMQKLGKGPVSFLESFSQNPTEQAQYEKTVIENAVNLAALGQDFQKYLEEKGVTQKDDFEEMFGNG